MKIAIVEQAAAAAWPALEEQELASGIFRFARGITRRTNSLTLFDSSTPELSGKHGVTDKPISLDKVSWLDSFYAISGQTVRQRKRHEKLISRIKGETFCALISQIGGAPSCCTLAINHKGATGISNAATVQPWRRQKYAGRLLSALPGWGLVAGAGPACLQLEESNPEAISLYRKIGFSSLYKCRNRVKAQGERVGRGYGQ